MTKYSLAFLFFLAAVMCAGCSQQSAYINPDEPDELGGAGIDSQEIRTVSDNMARDLVGLPALAGASKKPIIALLPVKNETHFRIDADIINLRIRNALIKFSDRATFVQRERIEDIRAERAAKRAGDVSSSGEQMVSGADYFLTGTIKELSKSAKGKEANYTYFSFELIDAESSNVVWANDYEVKKVAERGVLYR